MNIRIERDEDVRNIAVEGMPDWKSAIPRAGGWFSYIEINGEAASASNIADLHADGALNVEDGTADDDGTCNVFLPPDLELAITDGKTVEWDKLSPEQMVEAVGDFGEMEISYEHRGMKVAITINMY